MLQVEGKLRVLIGVVFLAESPVRALDVFL